MRSLLLILLLCTALPSSVHGAAPVKIIFDTDMDSDCDDVGALAMLHALADLGEAEILATTVSSKNPSSPLCVSAINQFYGRADLPVGVPKGKGAEKPTKYAKVIAERFSHNLESAEKAPDAVEVWRKVLEAQPDGSVTIVTVGYLTNVADLLKRPAEGERLSGLELVKRKVKQWVCMGGNFVGEPAKDDLKLGNNNFTFDKEGALYAVKNWPGRLLFVGREIGSVPSGLKVGARLKELPAENPIRLGYELYFGGVAKDRHVADQTTVLAAVRGTEKFWDLKEGGTMDLAADMTFSWKSADGGKQAYVLKRKENRNAIDREVEKVIEGLMMKARRQ